MWESQRSILLPVVTVPFLVGLGAVAWVALRPAPEPAASIIPPPALPAPAPVVAPGKPAPGAVPAPAQAASTPVPASVASPPVLPAAPVIRPSFDVVRVNPTGDAVIAGRAAPGAEVTVTDNGKDIGHAKADAAGEWVVVPAAPLAAGGQELALATHTPEGVPVAGEAPVVVVLPARGATASAAGPVVAVLTPTDAPPRVLQAPPGPAGQLGLQIVDYDSHGQIRFAGAAPAGSTVRLYVDNTKVGDAVADKQGRWTLLPDASVPTGDHRLRIDQLGANGRVGARIELPIQRAALAAPAPGGSRMVVQPRQNLWRIARETYGQGVRYTDIYNANRDQIRDPNLIYPGQVFALPAAPAGQISGSVASAGQVSASAGSGVAAMPTDSSRSK